MNDECSTERERSEFDFTSASDRSHLRRPRRAGCRAWRRRGCWASSGPLWRSPTAAGGRWRRRTARLFAPLQGRTTTTVPIQILRSRSPLLLRFVRGFWTREGPILLNYQKFRSDGLNSQIARTCFVLGRPLGLVDAKLIDPRPVQLPGRLLRGRLRVARGPVGCLQTAEDGLEDVPEHGHRRRHDEVDETCGRRRRRDTLLYSPFDQRPKRSKGMLQYRAARKGKP